MPDLPWGLSLGTCSMISWAFSCPSLPWDSSTYFSLVSWVLLCKMPSYKMTRLALVATLFTRTSSRLVKKWINERTIKKIFFQKNRIFNPLLDTATCYMTFTMFLSTLQEYCTKFDIEIVTVSHILLLTGLIILANLLFVGMVR